MVFLRILTKIIYNFKKKGKKVIQVCFGGDVRCWDAFQQEFNIDVSSITSNPIDNINFNDIINRLRKAELHASAIYSLKDQQGLGIRPYYRLYIPFEFEKYNFKLNQREIPKIVHFESRLPYKGEKFIYEAINNLKRQGLQFEFNSYKNITHGEVIGILEDADILVDECMIFGPGILGNESIASGCALATKMQEGHLIEKYVCNIDEHNIEEPLKTFILDKEKRIESLKNAYALLLEQCTPIQIAEDMIIKSEISCFKIESHDLVPKFYKKYYKIPVGHKLSYNNEIYTNQLLEKFNN